MPQTLTATVPSAADPASLVLDAERLDCYRLAVDFHALTSLLLPVSQRVLRDQLERASLSVVLNLAEGCGRRSRRDKARFIAMARGSAMECAAIVHIASVRGLAPFLDCRQGRAMLVRIVQMVTKLEASLLRRFS